MYDRPCRESVPVPSMDLGIFQVLDQLEFELWREDGLAKLIVLPKNGLVSTVDLGVSFSAILPRLFFLNFLVIVLNSTSSSSHVVVVLGGSFGDGLAVAWGGTLGGASGGSLLGGFGCA